MDTTALSQNRTCSLDFNAGNFGLDTLGIPGTNDQGIGDQRQWATPSSGSAHDSGFSQPATATAGTRSSVTSGPFARAQHHEDQGQHDFRGGYFLNFMYLDHWQPETGNPRGSFQFLPNTTGLRGGQSANFYNAYASFLLGQVGQANKSVQNELMTSREWQHALFFRDRWTPNSKLTVNLGLRWEFYPIMTRADGRGIDRLDLANADFARRLDVIIAGRGGNPATNGMEAGLNNFAPRVGGVYRMNELTVLRTGYGLTYNAQPWARPMRGHNDYPVTISSTFLNAEAFHSGDAAAGHLKIVGPVELGPGALDRAAGFWSPELGNIDRGYECTLGTSRWSGCCR
jgi:hypothetical protein